VYKDYDVIISPSVSVSPFPWEQLYLSEMDGQPLENYYRWLGLTYVVTLLTNPAISLPAGKDSLHMPFGLQVIGPLRQDRRLLDVAQALEGVFATTSDLARPLPDETRLRERTPSLMSIVTDAPDSHLALSIP